jgi:FHA domain
VHLEGNPRRDAFRAARHRVENAAGCNTIAGEVRIPMGIDGPAFQTLAPGEVPVKPATNSICWVVDRGKLYPLKVGLNSVGRLPDNDVMIEDPTVSRRHCAIMVHSDLSCELHDIASKNGTLVNGSKLKGPTRLKDGDEICLSEHRITFTYHAVTPVSTDKSSHSKSEDRTYAGV